MIQILVQGSRAELAFEGPSFVYLVYFDFEGVFPSWCQTGAEQDLVPPSSQPVGKIIMN